MIHKFKKKAGSLIAATLLLPLSSASVWSAVDTRDVRVNQIGYLPLANKVATVITSASQSVSWELRQGSTVVLSGNTSVYGLDRASQDNVHKVDFSSYSVPGSYRLWVQGEGESVAFDISDSLYPDLPAEAMEYFYLHRMGEPILEQHVSEPAWARAALHPGDDALPCYQDWCAGEVFDVKDSWADAGDFGIYAVNHAISAWTLLNLYEADKSRFADNSLNIPESGNGIPDILDEVVFGSTFMPGMLPKNTNLLASHKAHNTTWSGFPLTEASIPSENTTPRHVRPPSTNATYAVARTSAHIARLIQPYNAAKANELWRAAKDAFDRASNLPLTLWTIVGEQGGGPYADRSYLDDRYAAAVEMYLTARALSDNAEASYKSTVTSSEHFGEIADFGWIQVDGSATLSLIAAEDSGLSAAQVNMLRSNIITAADNFLDILNNNGYPTPYDPVSYDWGSNSTVLNRMIVMAYAHQISGDNKYLNGLLQSMDYLMGNNSMKLSYITGYGEFNESDTHDRLAWGYYINNGISYPKGWVSGGPMTNSNSCVGESSTPLNVATAKGYAAPDTAPSAWCSKENTINWNAPLVWVATYIQENSSKLGSCSNSCAPTAADVSIQTLAGSSSQVTLSASDADGSIASYTIVDAPQQGSATVMGNTATYIADATANGLDSFTYTATDDDGLVSNVATVSVNISAETVSIGQPQNNQQFFSNEVITVSFSSNTQKDISLYVDGVSQGVVSGSSVEVGPLAAGAHTIELRINNTTITDSISVSVVDPAPAGVSCELGGTNIWNSGFVLNNIEVTNTGTDTINNWSVRIPVNTAISIVNAWNATVTVSGNTIIANSIYPLRPGASIAFGMQGAHSGNFNAPSSCVEN
ncbi:glycoside hydrolase family 9 protein [Agarilytica rhodophyticola]|uniref:glycoside hydrolase family 9 protein n=1 Tax=Agarilytica rhodophyticola TaxID=1737490 RepID=UPI000B3496CD|nr:glycoside hydrolase family 9 protein [Agarilytica rhodophyticola]